MRRRLLVLYPFIGDNFGFCSPRLVLGIPKNAAARQPLLILFPLVGEHFGLSSPPLVFAIPENAGEATTSDFLGGLNCPRVGGGGLRNEGHSWGQKKGELLPPNCTHRTTSEVFA